MDEKIRKSLALFAEGKDRNEVSKRLGYKSYKVLDMYFRRRNYRWNPNQGTYMLIEQKVEGEEVQDVVISKAQQIISLLALDSKDPRELARQAGFSDIQQMADYMLSRGFVWNCDRGNYERNTGLEIVQQTSEDSDAPAEPLEPTDQAPGIVRDDLSEYIGILTMLQKHKDRLIDLLTIKPERKIPRYIIAGSNTAKSLQIPVMLDKIVKDFSTEKNITQKDVLTVALIEFLMKYGFEVKVEYMLNAGRA